jgi:hypothetical protein
LKPPGYLANFDSTTAMLRATAAALRGEDFPMLGALPRRALPLARVGTTLVNALPAKVREGLYTRSGGSEAISPGELGGVSAEDLSRWAAGSYPRSSYPAVAVGSSNGALAHLWAALGVPWLPQTFLVPVRRSGVPVDEPKADLEWGKRHAASLLEANPDVMLHQMHDANQDRLMLRRMAYFRIKKLRLGEAYESFIRESLPPGGTVFLVECRRAWPTTRVGERHVYQHGAVGGATEEEFLRGGERVEGYLRRYGSPRKRWDSPEPDGENPEAEWGFEPALRESVERLARQEGYRVRRILFEEPEDPSPFVADLYRRWYGERGIPTGRLLIESFIMLEPHLAIRTGSVPLWTVFPTEPSLERAERYLDRVIPFEEIRAMLFSHGVESVGLPPIARWREVLKRARRYGGFVGVDEGKFPRDYAAFIRYNTELRKVRPLYPPAPLSLEELDAFLEEAAGRYPVRWL